MGSLRGQHKLCPKVSLEKTVEGVIDSLVPNIAAMLAFEYIFQVFLYAYQVNVLYLSLLPIDVGGAMMSVLGGLTFSPIKRSYHIKGLGELIPKHGGILGRFDSIIFVSPSIYLLVWVLSAVVR